jgi:hypothetical protein
MIGREAFLSVKQEMRSFDWYPRLLRIVSNRGLVR